MIGLLGKKLGMTHVYDDYGRRIAVTAVQAGPCTVLDLRDPKRHGYQAVQVGFEPVKESRVTKARLGHFKKAGASPFRYIREFRTADAEWKVGQQLTVELFQPHELVDVTGTSIGKGFQGGMKRWHWKGGRATHGSMQHRAPGSIGSTTTPGRVWRGHHLPGHMGADRVTVQNLRIARLDLEHHLLLIEGALPGAEEQLLIISKSRKHPGFVKKPQEFQAIIEDDESLSKTAKAALKTLKPAKK
ncbi:MAG: 50S ribosomal protein L3 [Candidatus Omnitrophica bacterium]|nr:50S ribosomal protein L3 [Candidatus Omnitrophota bacterium]